MHSSKKIKSSDQSYSVVDVMKVRVDPDQANSAVKVFQPPDSVPTVECDIFIAGGGTAGVAAALAGTAGGGVKVCLTEETDWLGGQMTAQGVPVSDDGRNFQVETSGSNRSYQLFRDAIRNHYKQNYKLSASAQTVKFFNPGNCWYWVSQLAFQPAVGVAVLHELLNQADIALPCQIYLRRAVVKVVSEGEQIERVITVNLDTGEWLAFKARTYIDATELGDLLHLSGAPYRSGTESRSQTGESHAADVADADHVQDYVFPFVVEFVPGTDNTIAKHALYDQFKSKGKFSLLNYKMFGHGHKLNADGVIISELMPFWTYRRILDKNAFADQRIPHDQAVINWFSNDFSDHNIIDKPPSVVCDYLRLAKSCSLSFLYWLQTEAPRDEGGYGYPEIRLVVNALGTEDGLSKYPYIRESRRGVTFTIIKEADVTSVESSAARARLFDDSVGIGFFPIDIHGKESTPGALKPTKHFQIPLSAMLMQSPANLILSAKNIGTTHLTNGAYRLHPIEWAIGEAAGSLAVLAGQAQGSLHDFVQSSQKLRLLQVKLIRSGAPLYWYDDVSTVDSRFEAIQYLSVIGLMRGDSQHLHFYPDQTLTAAEVEEILDRTAQFDQDFDCQLKPPPSVDTRGAFAVWLYGRLPASSHQLSLSAAI